MKTKQLLTIMLTLFCMSINAQYQTWQWAKSTGGSSSDIASSISTNAAGNTFMVGSFSSPSITFGLTTLTNLGSSDVFLAKYDASGTLLWAKSVGGANDDIATSIFTDVAGNIYITGYSGSQTMTFGNTTLTSSGSWDIFLAKYDTNGGLLWAKMQGGPSDDQAKCVTTDLLGNVYIAGNFQSNTLSFGSYTLTNPSLIADDIFIVKYNPAGTVLWAKSAGGTYFDAPSSLTTDAFGNVYMAGAFQSNDINFGTTTLTNANQYSNDIFLAKYDSIGNILWAKSAGGINSDVARSIATDTFGNVYMAGHFQSLSINFGSTILTNADISGNTSDIFIAKYNSAGIIQWAKIAGGATEDQIHSIHLDASENVFVSGYFDSPSIALGSTTLTNADNTGYTSDVLLASYDSIGNVVWAKRVGGVNSDVAESISTDGTGNVYVAGVFQSNNINFGSTTLLNSSIDDDIFLAKLSKEPNEIEHLVGQNYFSVFPNPFSLQTTIQTDVYLNNANLTVYNTYGQQVKQLKNITGENITLQRGTLTSGIYFVQLTQGNSILVTEKLFVTEN